MARKPVLYADPDKVAKAARELTSGQLACRSMRHHWGPHTVTWDNKDKVYDVVIRCQSCGSFEDLIISMTGRQLYRSSPRYSPGYLIKAGGPLSPESKDSLRLDWLLGSSSVAGKTAKRPRKAPAKKTTPRKKAS